MQIFNTDNYATIRSSVNISDQTPTIMQKLEVVLT